MASGEADMSESRSGGTNRAEWGDSMEKWRGKRSKRTKGQIRILKHCGLVSIENTILCVADPNDERPTDGTSYSAAEWSRAWMQGVRIHDTVKKTDWNRNQMTRGEIRQTQLAGHGHSETDAGRPPHAETSRGSEQGEGEVTSGELQRPAGKEEKAGGPQEQERQRTRQHLREQRGRHNGQFSTKKSEWGARPKAAPSKRPKEEGAQANAD